MSDIRMKRMEELVELLTEASKAYYAQDKEIMSNLEYDTLYAELEALEAETGIVLSKSPTREVGYEAVDFLPKEAHEKPMLSLGKTKEREELVGWLGEKEALLSWKLDGLTIVLTYQDGKLVKGLTRGNGTSGEVVTSNVKTFTNIPLQIAFQGELVLRGEAVISYSDFEWINGQLPEGEEKYKNPRNLCSGSVRQLNSEVTANRRVSFYAFSLVKADGVDAENSVEKQMEFMKQQGFSVVEYKRVNKDNLLDAIGWFEKEIISMDVPSDGLVLTLDDIAYGESLGRTAKSPRNAIAFKWADELRETVLKEIEWSPSRTGLINPVAVFEPVELEGTTVSRASVHNVSIMEDMALGIGDRITVYKANMIIPQIAENLTRSNNVVIPKICPVCGGETMVKQFNGTKELYCVNPLCQAKKIKAFSHFVSRDAMNMEGLSEATLEKFIGKGFIHEFADIYRLERFKEQIVEMEGFGEKSYENLQKSVEKTKVCPMPGFINALGIPNVGLATAKLLCKFCNYDFKILLHASSEELSGIEGIGDIMAEGICRYFADTKNRDVIDSLLQEVTFEKPEEVGEQPLAGMSFVVTGSLLHFPNRNALKDEIERLGGKVTGSVTGNTVCLINNDTESTSSKNKKAKELGVEILSEEAFMERYLK